MDPAFSFSVECLYPGLQDSIESLDRAVFLGVVDGCAVVVDVVLGEKVLELPGGKLWSVVGDQGIGESVSGEEVRQGLNDVHGTPPFPGHNFWPPTVVVHGYQKGFSIVEGARQVNAPLGGGSVRGGDLLVSALVRRGALVRELAGDTVADEVLGLLGHPRPEGCGPQEALETYDAWVSLMSFLEEFHTEGLGDDQASIVPNHASTCGGEGVLDLGIWAELPRQLGRLRPSVLHVFLYLSQVRIGGGGGGVILPGEGLEERGVRGVPIFFIDGVTRGGGHSQLLCTDDETTEGVGDLVRCAGEVLWGEVEDGEALQPSVELAGLPLRRVGGQQSLQRGVVRSEDERSA